MKMSSRDARLSKGVTATHMAKIIGVARQSYYNREAGIVPWSYREAELVSKELNIPMNKIDFNLPEVSKKNETKEKRR